ncbi:hypothetical protein [Helicobacter suis]|uniref:hypothetical protein n=1 Tax=Helicobacter suis TaxID=104628 RepID=UPI0013D1F120|nr:hypothetical protein [Helicobacter suis]
MEDYPEYFIYYKPTLLSTIEGGDDPELSNLLRVIDIKLKNDVFTLVPVALQENLSDLRVI